MVRGILRSPAGLIGAILVTLLLVLAIIGPEVFGARANQINPAGILLAASAHHLLGTDELGRDIFARVMVATRTSLVLAALATGIGVAAGLPLGLLPVVLPPRARRLIASVISTLVSFPGLLLAMFTSIVLGLGAKGAVFGIGIAAAPAMARLTLTLASSVGGSDYVAAARLLRVPRWRIMTRHILPNIAEPLILNVTMIMVGALIGLAGLSFIGLGVQPPSYDWGVLLSDGVDNIYTDPAYAIGPAVAILLAGVGLGLLGERLARIAARERTAVKEQPATREAQAQTQAPAGIPDELPAETAEDTVLDIRDLTVTFPGGTTPVAGVSLRVSPGEIVGIVGESGSGKSLTTLGISGLVPYPGTVRAARHEIAGTEISTLPSAARRRLLGTSLAMVFQDPMASLNPAMRIGTQLAEVPMTHEHLPRRAAWQRAVDRLGQVRIPDPGRQARQRPHQFSGGMRQRTAIAIGLMGTPRLLIADEPTTALDVTVQRKILELLADLTQSTKAGALFISHDIAVVSQICDRVLVMYAGRVV
jgi:peptide/nickel transport system permease protein